MSEKARCLLNAAECERLADESASQDRASLLNMARAWRELAASAEAFRWNEREFPGVATAPDR